MYGEALFLDALGFREHSAFSLKCRMSVYSSWQQQKGQSEEEG